MLPLYLVYAAGFSPLALGVIDGLYRGAAAIAALASGFWADRRKRHKEVAALGYGLSAMSKLGLVAAGGAVGPIAVFVMLDRIGKGIRTAPRDALISLSASPKALGHRVRRPPRDGHHRRHDRAADGVRDPGARAAGVHVRLPRLVLRRDRRARRDRAAGADRARDARDAEPPLSAAPAVAGCCSSRRFRALVDGRVAAGPRDDQRRLPLPRAAAQARPRAGGLPAAVRGRLAGVHAARRARRASSPTASAAAASSSAATCCCCRSTRAARAAARGASGSARARARRRLLRGDRRRARRAGLGDARRGGARERALRADDGDEPVALRGLGRVRRAVDVGGPRTRRSSCAGSRSRRRSSWPGWCCAPPARWPMVRSRTRALHGPDARSAPWSRSARWRPPCSASRARRGPKRSAALAKPYVVFRALDKNAGPRAPGRAHLDRGLGARAGPPRDRVGSATASTPSRQPGSASRAAGRSPAPTRPQILGPTASCGTRSGSRACRAARGSPRRALRRDHDVRHRRLLREARRVLDPRR